MSNLSLNEECYTTYGTIPTIRSEHRARSFSDSESTNGKLPLMMSPRGHNGLTTRPSCGQNGITTPPGVNNGYTDGCIKVGHDSIMGNKTSKKIKKKIQKTQKIKKKNTFMLL